MAKSLIIVESPAKARTLQRYLGKDFTVKASVGHVRDLPVKNLGVDVDNGFLPQYVTIRGKGKILTELRSAAKKADAILLAPDPDREGEAIAWHIAEALKSSHKPIHRVLFHELTKKAILEAINNATEIDHHKFEAQQARRILDRLVGYKISPLLWDKVRRGLSAGRVQSVAVRMVCDREEEVNAFVPVEYWSITTELQPDTLPPFQAQLDKINGKKIDKAKNRIPDQKSADKIITDLKQTSLQVKEVRKKAKKRNPAPPFITSTLQIEANRKLRFSAKKTMMLAQRLYEGIELGSDGPTGLITYMRTDSTRISDEAIDQARTHISSHFDKSYLPAKARRFKTKKAAQDAHEAIRPTDALHTPEKMAGLLEKDMLALYTLIWKRFIASQMTPAIYDQTTIIVQASEAYELRATGSILRFDGFMNLYQDSQSEGKKNGKDPLLPDIKEGTSLNLSRIEPKQHFTQPPARYTEASLVKALEENGVGRPSTYAAILSTIQDKEYVQLLERKFFPTDLGKLINELLVGHFPAIMNVDFTASMEQKLDQVEEGASNWQKLLSDFYDPFQQTLASAKEEMRSVKRSAIPTDISCPKCDGEMQIKWGKMGEFLACSGYPECTNTQDFTRDKDGKIIPTEKKEPEASDKICDKCGKAMVYKHGRFGRFLACSGYPECKNIMAESTGIKCPEENCSGDIVKKVSKRGKVFYSCNQFPDCKYALWDKPVDQACPLCDSPFLLAKESKKNGPHLRCPKKDCAYLKKKDEE